ncbi:NlpC/P60 family protein [Brevundimonas kwangchunensis]|uniref:NlpC/P60 family protein n=1 Tax=Brevundimonas kwangchunensis TaxID=322163 RepID=A0ABP3SD20_9CAUL
MTATDAIFDPRTTLARADLAEQGLEGIVRADVHRAAQAMRCATPMADIVDASGQTVDQLVFGEAFDALETLQDRAWGQARRDGVVGWVDRAALSDGVVLPRSRVTALDADLPPNALVADDAFSPVGEFETDPLAFAERWLGVPHRLGGRTPKGTDCCGLVQQALYACGRAGPRYADEQAELGRAVSRADARRGDLVVWLHPGQGPWNGHSAFLLDGDRVLHATGHHGAVAVEPLAEALARYAADGFEAPVFRRL